MKKLFFLLVSLPLCFLLAAPVHADVLTGPQLLFDFDSGHGYLVIGVLVLVVGFVLWRLLRKNDK